MFGEREKQQLREKAANVLRSATCTSIRFRLDNVRIERSMYPYIAGAILENRVHIEEGGGDGYDHTTNTIFFQSTGVQPATIVHEATHAVIDATMKGQNITKGTGEAVAYLAEAQHSVPGTFPSWLGPKQNGCHGFPLLSVKVSSTPR
jgi:hypothetical protein